MQLATAPGRPQGLKIRLRCRAALGGEGEAPAAVPHGLGAGRPFRHHWQSRGVIPKPTKAYKRTRQFGLDGTTRPCRLNRNTRTELQYRLVEHLQMLA